MNLQNAIICCGFQKCGTTSLWDYVVKSSSVSHFLIKERDFFNENHLPSELVEDKYFVNKTDIFFDTSPQYANKFACQNIISYGFNRIEIIFLVRDPIERIKSQISQQLRNEDKDLDEIFNDIEFELNELISLYAHSNSVPATELINYDIINSGIVANSCYSGIINHYRKAFGPEKIHVFDLEAITQDTNKLNKIFLACGLEMDNIPFSSKNSGGYSRFTWLKSILSSKFIRPIFRFIIPKPLYAKIWWLFKTEILIDAKKKHLIQFPDALQRKLEAFFSGQIH